MAGVPFYVNKGEAVVLQKTDELVDGPKDATRVGDVVTLDATTKDPHTHIVRTFEWDNPLGEWDKPMGGTFWKFKIDGWQLLKLTVPDVILDDGKGNKETFQYTLSLLFKWQGGHTGIDKLIGQGGGDPTSLLVHEARRDLVKTQKPPGGKWTQLVNIAVLHGMELKKDAGGDPVVDIVKKTKPLSKEEILELDFLKEILQQKAIVSKHLFEHELAIAVSAKHAEQWAKNYEHVARVKTDYMMAMNAVAKGAGGRDRSHSRVAACCCCSVASKVGASIWGSGEGGGGGGGGLMVDTDFTTSGGLKQSTTTDIKTEVGNKIKWSSDIETTPPDPPPSKSGPLKMALLTVPPAPGDAVGAKLPAALAGAQVNVPPPFITSAAGTASAAGKGAALDLTFDPKGTVTAIGVTGPGKDYEAGNTLKVKKESYSGAHDLTITISQDNIDA